MSKRKYSYLALLIVALIVIGIAYIIMQKKVGEQNNAYKDFGSKLSTVSEVATNFHSDGLRQLCNYNGDYKLGSNTGDSYYINFDKSSFIEKGGVLDTGPNLTEHEFLSKIKLSREQVLTYINFLKHYNYISCVEEDINVKTGTTYAIGFLFGSYPNEKIGYLYISDGSIDKDVNTKYLGETYNSMKPTSTSNWYEFEFNANKRF